MTKTTIFDRASFADKVKVALQNLESETDKKLTSLMKSEAESKIGKMDEISKNFHNIVKISSHDGKAVPQFPDEIYAAVMKRIVAVEATKISGGPLNEGGIIKRLGGYIADLLDKKPESILVKGKTYTLTNPFGQTSSTVTVTMDGNKKYTFSWNNDEETCKSLSKYLEKLKDYETENFVAVFFALMNDGKNAFQSLGSSSDGSAMISIAKWVKGLMNGKKLKELSSLNGIEYLTSLSTKNLDKLVVAPFVDDIYQELKPLLEIYGKVNGSNKKAAKLLGWIEKGSSAFTAFTEAIFDDNKKAISNITKKYNTLVEKSSKLADMITNFNSSDESLIQSLNKKSSAYNTFISAYNSLENQIGKSKTAFSTMIADCTSYELTAVHNETVKENHAFVSGTNQSDTINVQGNYVKVYSDDGADDMIASGNYITLIGEQGDDNFLIRETANYNYVDAGAGNDTIFSYSNDNTVNGNDGNDYMLVSAIYSDSVKKNEVRGGEGQDTIWITATTDSTIFGEAGNDSITVDEESKNNTIIGGTGNDAITLENSDSNFIVYSAGDGDDTVFGVDSNDTLYIAEGSYSQSTSGTDIIVSVGSNSILLKNAVGKNPVMKKPTTLIPLFKDSQLNKVIFGTSQDDKISNTINGANIDGGNGNDTISSSGLDTTIDSGNGKDFVRNYGAYVSINGGSDNDNIDTRNSYVTIDGGMGNDSIYSDGEYVKIDGGSDNDFIRNQNDDNVTIDGGLGDDTISSNGSSVTIDGGLDDDTISSSGSSVTIDGGLGDDTISSWGSNVTIDGGLGDDSIGINGEYVKIDGGSDNDYIANSFTNNVTIDGGDGEDIIILNNNNQYIKINGGANNDKISLSGLDVTDVTIGGGVGDDSVDNNGNYVSINGDAGNDSIENGGDFVSINSGADSDSVYNSGDHVGIISGLGSDSIYNNYGGNVTVNAGDGNDTIENYGAYVAVDGALIDGGSGDDNIVNSMNYTIIDGGNGNDTISNSGSKNSTIKGNAGDDLITVKYSSWNFIVYSVGDGNDTIDGFNADDTLQIVSGKITNTSVNGNDFIIYVGKGSIRLQNKVGKTLNLKIGKGKVTTLKADEDKPSWKVSGTTATYGNKFQTLVTVKGLSKSTSASDLSLNSKTKTVTLSRAALGTKKITISEGYKLALAKNVDKPKTTKAGFRVSKTTAKYFTKKISSGYTLASDKKSVSYTKASGGSTLVTLSGLKSGTKASKLTLKDKTVTLASGIIGSKGTSVKGGGYTFVTKGAGKLTNVGTAATFKGSSGKDTLVGGTGNDTIYGNDGNDYLSGGNGNDYLDGVKNNDTILGGKGNDTLLGGAGNDTLTGGAGKDVFVYSAGKDVITDYTADQDKIKISGTVKKTTYKNKDVIFTIGSGTLTVKNGKGKKISIENASGKTSTKTYLSSTSSQLWFADENNFVSSDNLGSIVKNDSTPIDYKIDTKNLKNLIQQNDFITFTGD